MNTEKTAAFKKSDFLNAKQLAEKLNADLDLVINTMATAYKRGVTITHMNTVRPIIIKNRLCHHSLTTNNSLQLHPLGMEKFKELLAKGK